MTPRLRTRLWNLRWSVVVLSAALVVAGLLHPIPFGLALRLWLVALGALTANVLVREAVGLYDPLLIPGPRWRREKATPPVRPADLAEVERAVQFSIWSAFDVRLRLTPLLREVAGQRLAGRRGITLEMQPEAAEAALGPALWRLIQPDGALPIRDTPGLSVRDMRAVVEALEAL